MKILMCRPDFFGIEYEINPWMSVQHKVDHTKAIKQWENLHHTLIECGAHIELVPPAAGWPDMTFTANAGLPLNNQIILSHFKHKERQGEVPYFQAWFEKAGFNVINPEDSGLYFEGAGDSLFAGDNLFAGYGFRTQRDFYATLPYFDQDKLVYCELVDPYFYHIDTCFCPLTPELAIWYPDAFSKESQQRMQNTIELIAVKQSEAKHFACNAVVLGKQVVLPAGCPDLSKELGTRGFSVHPCEMNEYLKSGGACKCLTLRLD